MVENIKCNVHNEIVYYSLNDFLWKSTGTKRSVTSCLDKISKIHIHSDSKRGRNSCTWVTIEGLKELVSKMPRFPLSVKQSLGVFQYHCSENEFGYVLEGFLNAGGIKFKRQYHYDKYNIDFVIESMSIAIEFNELHHRLEIDNDRLSILKKDFDVMIINSNDNVGSFLYDLSKKIWKHK